MSTADVTGRLAKYMVKARDRKLAPDVAREARHRILDSLAAMVSGAHLKPGEMAIRYARAQGGTAEATVVTTDIKTTAVNAALANGMFGHADETDDFHPATKAHPGCSVVPAALAMAEREGSSGVQLLNAVALGYDLCCRFLLALNADLVRASHRSAEGTSSTLGAVGAAAALARLDEKGMRHALSYAAQQVSGVWSWVRDAEHVEKAFDFSGMGARNGVTAAIMAQMKFSGVWDVFDGEHNALMALSSDPRPEELVADLGTRYFITETAIKPYSVGYPIQSPLNAFLTLLREHKFKPEEVEKIVARLPEDGARVVNDRSMPDVNCQHIIAVALVKGAVSFEDSHSYARMKDPKIRAAKAKVQLIGDPALMDRAAPRSGKVEVTLKDGRTFSHSYARMKDPKIRAAKAKVQLIGDPALMDRAAPRSGKVEVTLKDGRTFSHFTRHAPGTKENPMDTEAVNEKARVLMSPVIGEQQTEEVIRRVNALETVRNVRELARHLGKAPARSTRVKPRAPGRSKRPAAKK